MSDLTKRRAESEQKLFQMELKMISVESLKHSVEMKIQELDDLVNNAHIEIQKTNDINWKAWIADADQRRDVHAAELKKLTDRTAKIEADTKVINETIAGASDNLKDSLREMAVTVTAAQDTADKVVLLAQGKSLAEIKRMQRNIEKARQRAANTRNRVEASNTRNVKARQQFEKARRGE